MRVTSIQRKQVAALSTSQIRRSFIKYFEQEGHVHVPSSSVIPSAADSSLLFTNAGMNQFKGILEGTEPSSRWPPRVVSHQKCIRAGGKHNDLDGVGRDLHHLSFFEMLGNWSFNDSYSKRAACQFAWKYITEVLGISPSRLYLTYFGGCREWKVPSDEETRNIWIDLGVPPSRVLPFVAENFWEMGPTGPCGPSTEIHLDRSDVPRDSTALVNRDDSIVELWNIVFTNSVREEDGSVRMQEKMHVDTGAGLERLAAVIQGVHSNFDIDSFQPVLNSIAKISNGYVYKGRVGSLDVGLVDTAFRIVADHMRTAVVAVSDGARPAGVETGFVLRKILRRMAFQAVSVLGAQRCSLSTLVSPVIESLSDAYPDLVSSESTINSILMEEETKFWRLFDRGRAEFNRLVAGLPTDPRCISGEELWRLHNEKGISPDIVELWATPLSLPLELEEYEKLRSQAREASQLRDARHRPKARA